MRGTGLLFPFLVVQRYNKKKMVLGRIAVASADIRVAVRKYTVASSPMLKVPPDHKSLCRLSATVCVGSSLNYIPIDVH